MLSVIILSVNMLSVIILSVVMLSVVMLNVVMVSVVALSKRFNIVLTTIIYERKILIKLTRGQTYKTFYGRKLQIFVIS